MLAGELYAQVRRVLEAYSSHGVLQSLTTAVNLAAERANMQPHVYQVRATEMRRWAEGVIAASSQIYLSASTKRALDRSEFAPFLPASLARTVLAGFPDNKNLAISSPEMTMLLNGAHETIGLLGNFVEVSRRIHVDTYNVPKGDVGVRLHFPRRVFDNDLHELPAHVEPLSDLFRTIGELRTGEPISLKLVSVSTSDLTILIAVPPDVAILLLKIGAILIVNAKTKISLVSARRKLQQAGLSNLNEGEISTVIEKQLSSAVDKLISESITKASDQRANELRIQIKKKCTIVIEDIAKGTRITFDNEDETLIDSLASAGGQTHDEVREQIEKQELDQMSLDQMNSDPDDLDLIESDITSGSGLEA